MNQKKGLKQALHQACLAHPGKRLQLWFQNEAHFGNKGRVAHRWYERGQRRLAKPGQLSCCGD